MREVVVRYPAEPLAHTELIARLLQKGDPAPVQKAVAAARAALPKTADARLAVGSLLAFRAAGRDRMVTLSPETSGAMAKVALQFVADALAVEPGNAEALNEKASIEALAKHP